MDSNAGEQNVDVIRRMFASMSAGDYDEMAARFADDIEFDLPYARKGSGGFRAGAIVFWREYHNPEAVTPAVS